MQSIQKCVIISQIFYINVQKSKDFKKEKRERKIGKYEGVHADWQKERSDNKNPAQTAGKRSTSLLYKCAEEQRF